MCLTVEIKVANFSCEVLKDHGISHLPQCKRSTLEEFLNSELVVLEKHLGSRSIIRHSPKNGLLNLFVNDVLFVPSVKKGTIFPNFWIQAIFDLNFENGVGVTIQPLNFNIILRLQLGPLLHMLGDMREDRGDLMGLIGSKFI